MVVRKKLARLSWHSAQAGVVCEKKLVRLHDNLEIRYTMRTSRCETFEEIKKEEALSKASGRPTPSSFAGYRPPLTMSLSHS